MYYNNGEPQGSSGMAVASMSIGILSLILLIFLCCFPYVIFISAVLSIIGIALGGFAIKNNTRGKGMAVAGLVCSIITLVLSAVIIISLIVGAAWLSEISEDFLRELARSSSYGYY